MRAGVQTDSTYHHLIALSTLHYQFDLLHKFRKRSQLSIIFLQHNRTLSEILSLEQISNCSAIWNYVTIHQPYLVIVFYDLVFIVRDGMCIEIYLVFWMANESKLDASTLRTLVDGYVFMAYKGIM